MLSQLVDLPVVLGVRSATYGGGSRQTASYGSSRPRRAGDHLALSRGPERVGTLGFVGLRELLLRRLHSALCPQCGHPLARHRKQRAANGFDEVRRCRSCDCVLRTGLPVQVQLQVDGPPEAAAVPILDVKTGLGLGSDPLIAQTGHALNDAPDPSVFGRVDTNTHSLHGGFGSKCALCARTITAGQAVRKRVDGTYCHDVCPA